jgi:tetratricopeptide (TPR) repeat protein
MTSTEVEQPAAANGANGVDMRARFDELKENGKPRDAAALVAQAVEDGVESAELVSLANDVVDWLIETGAEKALVERTLRRAATAANDAAGWRRLGSFLEEASRTNDALDAFSRAAQRSDDDKVQAEILEHMGDLANEKLGPQDGLKHYQAAFRAHRGQRTAVRKAADLYLDTGRETQAKQLLDLEGEIFAHMAPKPDGLGDEIAERYLRVAENLLVRPTEHATASEALDAAARLADSDRVAAIREELETFPQRWKEHVRRLRDAALDVRDKREAAQNYLSMARLYRAYAPDDRRQMEQNVDKCLLIFPGYRPALKFLEDVHREEGQVDAFIERLRKQASSVRKSDVAVDLWLYVSVLVAEQGASPEDLVAIYEEVRKLDPKNQGAINALTELHMEAGEFAKAAQVMEDFLKEITDPAVKRSTLRTLGRLYEVELENLEAAVGHLQALWDLAGDDDVLLSLVEIHEKREEHKALADALEELLRTPVIENRSGGRVAALEQLLALYKGPVASPEKALDTACALFEHAPTDALEAELIRLADQLARPIKLAEALERGAARADDASTTRRYRLAAADSYLSARESAKARQVLDQLLAADPQDHEATERLDKLLLEEGAPEELAKVLQGRLATLETDEERLKTHLLLAETFQRLRQHDAQIESLRAVTEIAPEHDDALRRLEQVLRQLERFDELVEVIERRMKVVQGDERRELGMRFARLLDERLDRADEAADNYLALHEEMPEDSEILRALERLLGRGVKAVAIAEALQPYYAKVEAWRPHVQMLALRRDAETDSGRRAALSQTMAEVFEQKLRSPKEAFDAWAVTLQARPDDDDALAELERLAPRAQAHAKLADVLAQAAEQLPDGPRKNDMLARRAKLLEGELGDQEAAIEAHKALLAKSPEHVQTIDALLEIYEARDAHAELREMLQRRVNLSADDDQAGFAARLGMLALAQFGDADEARPQLERALAEPSPVQGRGRPPVLKAYADVLRGAVEGGSQEDAEKLVKVLEEVAGSLAGQERADTRAEVGSVLLKLDRVEEGLRAFEAALANDPSNPVAESGARQILESADAERGVRKSAARLLLSRYEQVGNTGGRAHVLHVQLQFDTEATSRRQAVTQLAQLMAEELESADEAFALLIEHLERDPSDAAVRQLAESLATQHQLGAALFEAWEHLRDTSEDEGVSRVYAERLADVTEKAGDLPRSAAALQYLGERSPSDLQLWDRLRQAYDRLGDAEGVYGALDHIASKTEGQDRVDRLKALSDFGFELLEDAERGFAKLEEARGEMPGDDGVLERMQARAEEYGRHDMLTEVLKERADIATAAPQKADLLLRRGALLLELGQKDDAVESLTRSLEIERDGRSTAAVGQLLAEIARGDDQAALTSLDAIIDHHRAQEAWQPLVESLEIAADKRPAGEERAALLDSVSELYETQLRVLPLAFREACRAFRDAPTTGRDMRVHELAEATSSFGELVAVLEDVAESIVESDPARAIELYREIVQLGREKLEDHDTEMRAAQTILRLDPKDANALASLERLHRADADRRGLIDVLERRAQTTEDAEVRHATLLELGQLLFEGEDVERAEQCFQQVIDESPENVAALAALDQLHVQTGNSAGLVSVLERRIALAEGEERGAMRVRLATVRLTRRGDPAGATDDLQTALEEDPKSPELRKALEALVEHARSHGMPPIGVAAELLEKCLRAQEEWASLPKVMELRLLGEGEKASRAALHVEIALVQEAALENLEFAFMAMCNALTETPADESIRSETERLATATEMEEALKDLYEDLVLEVEEPELQAIYHRRIAEIAERVSGDADEARRRLHAAVQSGANDIPTLRSLARLCRDQGAIDELVAVLARLAEVSVIDNDPDVAAEAYAELAEVEEGRENIEAALTATRELFVLRPDSEFARTNLERLYARAGEWTELARHLGQLLDAVESSEDKAEVLSRLLPVQLEPLEDPESAVTTLERISMIQSESPHIETLGAKLLQTLRDDGRDDARVWRARAAVLLEPRYLAAEAWPNLSYVLRLRLEVTADIGERKGLWLRIVDLYEQALAQPEQAFMAVGRALGESPEDEALRERAERISVQLGDIETLIGLYLDIGEKVAESPALRARYAIRCGELYEGSVGDPKEAVAQYEIGAALIENDPEQAERYQTVVERLERLNRVIGDPAGLASALRRRAALIEDDMIARQFLFEAATIQTHGLEDYAAAITTLEQLLERRPDDIPALRAMAEACSIEERWPEAAQALERELNAMGDSADPERTVQAQYELAVLFDGKLGQHDAASEYFDAVLATAPQHAPTRAYLEQRMEQGGASGVIALTRAYEATGDWAKAVEILRQQAGEAEGRGERADASTLLLRVAQLQEEKLGQIAIAFGTLCTALTGDSANVEIRERVVRVAIENELAEELCEVLEELGEDAEDNGRNALAADLREQAASLYADPIEDLPRAIEAYEQILEKHPGRIRPLDALREFYAAEGRFDELESILRRRLMFLDDPKERVPLITALASTLADHLDREDEAIPLLEDARKSEPDNGAVRLLLIDLYSGSGELEGMKVLLEEELKEAREQQETARVQTARTRLAALLTDQLPDDDGAIALWEEMRSENPGDDGAFSALERLYERAERWTSLKDLYEERLEGERDPALISRYTTKLGELLSTHLGSREEAVDHHLKVLELDPRNRDSLNALRQLYKDLEKWDELVSLLRRMMRFSTEAMDLKEYRFDLAEVLSDHQGKRAEAVETGRRILDIEPHSSEELKRLSGLFERNEAFEELGGVLERYADAVEGEEKTEVLVRLGRLYEESTGRPEYATRAYAKACANDPTQTFAYGRLCELYAQQGEWRPLVNLKDERYRHAEDPGERLQLLKEIGQIHEEQLDSEDMAFLAACRAFRERQDDPEVAAWMDRLAVATDSVEELVTIYDDALDKVESEERILAMRLRMAELYATLLAEPDEAETHLKRVLEYQAGNVEALDGLYNLFDAQERWSDAVGILERKAEQVEEQREKIDILRQIAAVQDEKAEDVDGAAAAFRRILEIDGRDKGALEGLVALFERAERWQSLITVLEREELLAEDLQEKLELRYRIATVQEQQLEKPELAVATYRSILDEDGTFVSALKALERLYTDLDRPRELVDVFERHVDASEELEDKTTYLGKISSTWEERLEDLPRAIDATERILEMDPENESGLKTLARLCRNEGRWERLVEVLQKQITLSDDGGEIIGNYLEIGEVYYRDIGKTDQAEQAYTAALDFDPSSRDALHALGQLYERSGNWFNALEKLNQEAQVVGGTPEGVELYYRIGKINEEMLLNTEAAREAYNQALAFDPGYLPAIKALKEIARAESERATGDAKAPEQEKYLEWLRAEAKHTEDELEKTELHTAAGKYLQETMEDIEGATTEYEAALAITFDHLEAARPLAELCLRSESFERAEQLLDIVTDRLDPDEHPQDLCRYHYRLGYVCERLEKDAKALKHYQKAYEIEPTYLEGLEGLGQALFRAERWEDAEKIYNAILIHHRDSLTDAEIVDYYHQLGALSQKMGDADKAVKHLMKALELDSSHGPSLRLLADVNAEGQDDEEAYEALMRLVNVRSGDDRVDLLIEIGQLSMDKLEDPYRAIDAFEDANRARPQDKLVLESLLKLYRQTKQGSHAVEVLEELVRIEPDEKARVRLNHTLGEVYRDELKNETRAVQYFNAALDLDPTYIRSFQSVEEMLSTSKAWQALEENYIMMLKRIPADQKKIKRELWKNLAGLYRYRLKNLQGAAQAYRVLHKMNPEDTETLEGLADLLSKAGPSQLDEAIKAYQQLLALSPEKPQRTLHALVRLYHNRRLVDRAFVSSAALKVWNDLTPEEAKLHAHYSKQQPTMPKAALTQRLWDGAVLHPKAKGPLADISKVLWQVAGGLLAQDGMTKELSNKRLWVRTEIDTPVPTLFVNHLKRVRDFVALGPFDLYAKKSAADPLRLLPTARPSFGVGEANEVFGELPDIQLRFMCARRVAYLYPSFILPAFLGPQRFQAVIEAAVRVVEPRYQPRSDPNEVAQLEKLLGRAGPQLTGPLRQPVAALLRAGRALPVRDFLEGMEHSAVRAAYVATGNLEMVAGLLRQADPGPMPLPYAQKVRELLTFAVSDLNFELRQRIGMAIQG